MDSQSSTNTAAGEKRRQFISNELRQWIVAQAQAGVPPEQVLDAMKSSGWKEDVAIQALEETLQAHLAAHQKSLNAAAVATDSVPAGVPVPEPSVSDSPSRVRVLDRDVNILFTMKHPRVI